MSGRGQGMALQASKGQGAGRGDPCARTCKTRALAAPRARTPGVRQNAKACQEAWVELGFNRSRLESSMSLVDMLVWQNKQVQNAN